MCCYMDALYRLRKHWAKAWWELQNYAMYCLEQIRKVTLHKTAVVWPFASHLTNHSNKMKKICGEQLERVERTPLQRLARVSQPVIINLHQLCEDKGGSLKDLQRAIDNVDREGETVRDPPLPLQLDDDDDDDDDDDVLFVLFDPVQIFFEFLFNRQYLLFYLFRLYFQTRLLFCSGLFISIYPSLAFLLVAAFFFFISPCSLISHPGFVFLFRFPREITILSSTSFASA